MKTYLERHYDSKFRIGYNPAWIWTGIGKWSISLNFCKLNNC